MPAAVKRRRRSACGSTVKRSRTRRKTHGGTAGSSFLGTDSPSLCSRVVKGLYSLCNVPSLQLGGLTKPWRLLTSLLDHQWTSLLGGVEEVDQSLYWCSIQDIAFEIFGYLDPASLARLSASSKQLRPSVKAYALHVVKHNYGDIPVGFASHALSLGVLPECPSFGALPLMHVLGPRLGRQRLFQPRADSLETVQSERMARAQHITRHMRTVLVDWMIEVAAEYRLSPICLHASVNLTDRCLGTFTIPRYRLQLLGCCCLLLESQRYPEYQMTISDVCYISDSQYDDFQVIAMFNLVTGNTQAPEKCLSAETVHSFLTTFLSHMDLVNIVGAEAPAVGDIAEDIVLSNLLADLSLLDYHMLRFYPSTVASSIIFLSRLMMDYFSTEHRLSITSMGLLTTQSREVLGLCKYHRPFIEKNPAYQEEPWGCPALRHFVQSYETEAMATAFCVAQLWRLHCDFMFHTAGLGDEPYILRAHHFMLKGCVDKYCAPDSDRATAYKTIGIVPEDVVHGWVRKHLKVVLPGTKLPRV